MMQLVTLSSFIYTDGSILWLPPLGGFDSSELKAKNEKEWWNSIQEGHHFLRRKHRQKSHSILGVWQVRRSLDLSPLELLWPGEVGKQSASNWYKNHQEPAGPHYSAKMNRILLSREKTPLSIIILRSLLNQWPSVWRWRPRSQMGVSTSAFLQLPHTSPGFTR